MITSKQQKLARAYRWRMDAAESQLDLALTYIQDGAPVDAARCAELAIQFCREATALKNASFGVKGASK